MSRHLHLSAALALVALAACATTAEAQVDEAAVLDTYADVAQATYEDSLTTARELQAAVGALLAEPSHATHQAAKDAWLAARVPYQQSEAYRFGNPLVDDWEGLVNAWPLDEGLIDYVATDYGTASDLNPFYVANVIANPELTSVLWAVRKRLEGERQVPALRRGFALADRGLHERDAFEAFERLFGAIGRNCCRDLWFHRCGCGCVSGDELTILGLVAAEQSGDIASALFFGRALVAPTALGEILEAARLLALALAERGFALPRRERHPPAEVDDSSRRLH